MPPPDATTAVPATAVEMRDMTMSFGGVAALKGVDFELKWGEIHALMGENGAGKSTLMKILEGVYQPDGGEILIEGEPVSLRSAEDARAHGIAMVFQEFSLVPTLTVAQNVMLGNERRTRLGLTDDRAAVSVTRRILGEMNVELDPRAEVGGLAAGYWQITEIAKALVRNARILVLDEPTASLTTTETQALFERLRRLRESGLAIVYISHRMAEIYDIADRITVMRDGRRIRTDSAEDFPVEQVIGAMLGEAAEADVRRAYTRSRFAGAPDAPPLLEVSGLQSPNGIAGVDLQVRAGEIVGLAGLMGSGRSELMRALFGIDRISAGTLRIGGREVRVRTPHDAMAAGLALVPEDRRVEGLVLEHTVETNVRLPLISSGFHGLLQGRAGARLAQQVIDRLDVRTDSVAKPVDLLSGGNQQKLVIGKWLLTRPQVFMLDEPTAGIDIGAKLQIMETLRAFADEGHGVLVVSSELQELLELSDRILLIREGRVERELSPDEFESEDALHRALQGV